MDKLKLTIMMLIKDEEEMLDDCLKALSWADEILLIFDDRTTDRSEEIARKYTDRIIYRRFDGFASQANFGLREAKNDWILHIAADERVSDTLRQEIELILKNGTKKVAFQVPFDTYLLGQLFKGSGFGDEKHIIFFNKEFCHYSVREIHEELDIDGEISEVQGKILHYTHRTIDHILTKIQTYSTLEAEHLFKIGARRVTVPVLIFYTAKHFVFRYIRRQGFRDGIAGFIEAYLQAAYVFVNYAKLWEIQRHSQDAESVGMIKTEPKHEKRAS